MEIFLTGATRVLGHPVVQRLVAAGHRVRALNRSEENASSTGCGPRASQLVRGRVLQASVDRK